MMSPLSELRSWILAVSLSKPLSDRMSRASSIDSWPAGTSQATPPSKSMPRTRPRVPSDSAVIASSTAETSIHTRRRPQKSIAVWARISLRHGPLAIRTAGVTVSTVVMTHLPREPVPQRAR